MANICCDDIYFYTDSNTEGLQDLWDDLEACIIMSIKADDSWIGNLFNYKGISTSDICLRGNVTYMERDTEGILLDLSTAWSPLYDAYQAIAAHYGVSFVCKSIEPGEEIYYNTDTTGTFFPEKYIISIYDEDAVTPSGDKVSNVLEDWDFFESEQELLDKFRNLGYAANSFTELEALLEDEEITVHTFENPWAPEDDLEL